MCVCVCVVCVLCVLCVLCVCVCVSFCLLCMCVRSINYVHVEHKSTRVQEQVETIAHKVGLALALRLAPRIHLCAWVGGHEATGGWRHAKRGHRQPVQGHCGRGLFDHGGREDTLRQRRPSHFTRPGLQLGQLACNFPATSRNLPATSLQLPATCLLQWCPLPVDAEPSARNYMHPRNTAQLAMYVF